MVGRTMLIFVLALAERGFAQIDSLADVFPLHIGQKWTYEFYDDYRSNQFHSASTDTGRVEYEVTGATFSPDTIHWQFFQREKYEHSFYSGHWQNVTINDSGTFEMIELNRGRHELYTPVFNGYRCFPFQKSYDDSSRFFRYVPVDSLGRAAVHLSFVDPSNPGPWWNYNCYFTVSQDSGILQARGGQSNFAFTINMRYYLSSFSPVPYRGWHLTHPRTIALLSVVGIPKVTTVELRNVGQDTVWLERIESTNDALVASVPGPKIPPYGSVPLTLRYVSNTEAATVERLVMYTTAGPPQDTIVVSIFNRRNASTTFCLTQNVPNPFNSTTRIGFVIPNDALVTLKVFDMLGREVATLVNEEIKAGIGERVFNGEGHASGAYIYQIRAGDLMAAKKFLLLK